MSRTERLRHNRLKNSPRYTDSVALIHIATVDANRIKIIVHDIFMAPCLIESGAIVELDTTHYRVYGYQQFIVNDHSACWEMFFLNRLERTHILNRYLGKAQYCTVPMYYHPYVRARGRRSGRSRNAKRMKYYKGRSDRFRYKARLRKLIRMGDYESV